MKQSKINLLFGFILTFGSSSLCFFISSAKADGTQLLRFCDTAEKVMDGDLTRGNITATDLVNMGFCIGFISGVVGSNTVLKETQKGRWFCPPQEFTPGEGVRILTKYLREHPKNLHSHEAELAWPAFFEAFPCKS